MDLARNAGRYAEALAARQQLLRLRRVQLDLTLQAIDQSDALRQKRLAHAQSLKEPTDTYEAKRKRLREDRQEAQQQFDRAQPGLHKDIAAAAVLAGDGAVFRQAINEAARLYQQRNDLRELSSLYTDAPENLVVLTGDRQAAAQMLTEGKQLQINQAQGAEQERLRNWWQKDPKPAWWPPAK
jgi:hypothetical protein